MNFRLWLEMGNLATMPTDHINFDNNGSIYIYKFEYNEQKFKVKFEKTKNELMQIPISDSYTVSFTGPYETSQTNMAGTSATAIYTRVLLAVKKFLETYNVNGLVFSGANYNMDLVYRRFYKEYLQKDFIQTDEDSYINKEYLRKFLDKYPQHKEIVYRKMIYNNRLWTQTLNRRVVQKNTRRQKMLLLKSKINSFAYIESLNGLLPCYIYNIDKNGVKVLMDSGERIYTAMMDYRDFNLQEVPTNVIKEFLMKCQNSFEAKWFLKQPEGQPLLQLMKFYRISNQME